MSQRSLNQQSLDLLRREMNATRQRLMEQLEYSTQLRESRTIADTLKLHYEIPFRQAQLRDLEIIQEYKIGDLEYHKDSVEVLQSRDRVKERYEPGPWNIALQEVRKFGRTGREIHPWVNNDPWIDEEEARDKYLTYLSSYYEVDRKYLQNQFDPVRADKLARTLQAERRAQENREAEIEKIRGMSMEQWKAQLPWFPEWPEYEETRPAQTHWKRELLRSLVNRGAGLMLSSWGATPFVYMTWGSDPALISMLVGVSGFVWMLRRSLDD